MKGAHPVAKEMLTKRHTAQENTDRPPDPEEHQDTGAQRARPGTRKPSPAPGPRPPRLAGSSPSPTRDGWCHQGLGRSHLQTQLLPRHWAGNLAQGGARLQHPWPNLVALPRCPRRR